MNTPGSPNPHKPEGELKAIKKLLDVETVKRKAAERALMDERQQHSSLLKDAILMQKQLRQLSHDVLWAQEEERKKISRELHDEISQILTGINVRLATLRLEAEANTEDLCEKIASTQRLVEESVATVHRFAQELRPVMLDDLGLIPALTSYMKDIRTQSGLKVHLTTSRIALIEQMGSLMRTVLYRIVQEAIKNVVTHAKASSVSVSIQLDSDQICLEITDDGQSFSVESVRADESRQCLGLIGLRERTEMVGGIFTIVTVAGKGTTVRAKIPQNNDLDESKH